MSQCNNYATTPCHTISFRRDGAVTNFDLTLSDELLPGLLQDHNTLGKLVEATLNLILDEQMRVHLQAVRHERSTERTGYRNGYRERALATRVGPLTLRIPQTRDGSFCPEIFGRYQRSEQAFVPGLMEMVVNGVSTRKVTKITEKLCGTAFSKSTVSRLTADLDERVQAFLTRPLDSGYAFLVVDAMYIKVRIAKRVVNQAVLIASAIRNDGSRDIVGLSVGDAESFTTWNGFFCELKARGLSGIDTVVSDHHAGLIEAIR
jgi:putative transposase